MNKYKTLHEWLAWMKVLNVKEIDLSLERVLEIGSRLDLLKATCPVITVAGTNGKGSCVAGLEAIYLAAGYKVGSFTTPYLFRYNEQVRLQGLSVDDRVLCDAFARLTEACGDDIRLTLFEYGTLAAFMIFKEADLDVWILEVGLGGRWDAVNVMDADVGIVTSIAMDHMNWLGDTREAIAFEKAGIFRRNKPAICGDIDPPLTLVQHALQIKAPLFCQNKEFGFKEDSSSWTWWNQTKQLEQLPLPTLALQNMSTVLMAIDLLQKRLPVEKDAIDRALSTVTLPGRIQVVPGEITQIFDVSHNPASVALLADYLKKNPVVGKTYAVFSMLADKDIVATIRGISALMDYWYIAPLPGERGVSEQALLASFKKADVTCVDIQASITAAYDCAIQKAHRGDRVIIFGSFRVLAQLYYAMNA